MTRISHISRQPWANHGAVVLIGLIVASLYLQDYRLHPAHPHLGFGDGGWWNWFDQMHYLTAAKAWVRGDLDPAEHWYLMGYPLLGALFLPGLGLHSYAAVDLLCLLASLWLFTRIAVRVLPPWLPMAGPVGAAIFAAATMGSPALREVWVVPWSSSGAAPFTFATLLAGLRCLERPREAGRVVWVGLAGGAIMAFRPSDVFPVGIACVIPLMICLARQDRPWPAILRSVAAGAVGFMLVLGAEGALYLLLYGWRQSPYLNLSASIGFEWRSLGLRWVTLGLGPRPLYDAGKGLVATVPWLPLGLATFPICLVLAGSPARRLAMSLLILAATFHIALYLTYRDLYPEGLYRYLNYHYFKWTFPVLLLFSVTFPLQVVAAHRHRVAMIAAVAAMLGALTLWRAEFTQIEQVDRGRVDDPRHTVVFHDGLTDIRDAVLISAVGSWEAIYSGATSLDIDGRRFTERLDYKLHPAAGGFFLVPLRPLPRGTATLTVDPGVTLDPSRPLLHARQSVMFGRPCWIDGTTGPCLPQSQTLIEPPALPTSGDIAMDTSGSVYRDGDWSEPEPNGLWTAGRRVAFRLPAPEAGGARFTMDVSAFVPPGAEPLRTSLSINGHELARWVFDGPSPAHKIVDIPANIAREQRILLVTLHIDNPRRPSEQGLPSSDQRNLGLFVLGATLTPTSR